MFTSKYFTTASVALVAFSVIEPIAAAPIKAIDADFADPSILSVDGKWYAYGTGSGGKKVQVATADVFEGPWKVSSDDGLPNTPGWVASNPLVWAPDVVDRGDGKYILYFSASSKQGPHCVGAAIGSSPTGPFTAQDDPLACPVNQGGAIDPAGFKDTNGDVYVVYKVDGNSKGDGSWTCGQSKKNPKPTPIMLQKLQSDWMTPDGDPKQILDRDNNDGPLVEAPSLNFKDGLYYLYFSSNCYSTTLYDTSYATASSVAGPYTKALKPDAPLLVTGNFKLTAPGGTDVSPDGTKIAFHADTNGKDSSSRSMWVASINEGNKKVTIS